MVEGAPSSSNQPGPPADKSGRQRLQSGHRYPRHLAELCHRTDEMSEWEPRRGGIELDDSSRVWQRRTTFIGNLLYLGSLWLSDCNVHMLHVL